VAHIFAGEVTRIDDEALGAMKTLPDDFWVYAEFNGISRNVDWFVTRAASHQPSVLMLMELKRVARPLRGSIDSAWEITAESGGWQEIAPSNSRDINYYWQSVNTANVLAEWLWNHQQRYRETPEVRPQEEFKVWPDLVLLSPADVGHRLPLGPPSRYGRWWYTLEDWLRHVLTWKPRSGISLTPRELTNLGEALGLERITAQPVRASAHPSRPPDDLVSFVTWLRSLEERLSRLETLLEASTGAASAVALDGTPEKWGTEPSPPAGRGPVSHVRRSLTDEERTALLEALAELRQRGRSRALPTVIDVLNFKLGYRLQDTNYNGFGSARFMFDQARADQIIKFGGYSGPNPLIYAEDEEMSEP